MPENTSDKNKINWKNILIGIVIGAAGVGMITVGIWYFIRSKESTTATTVKTTTDSAKKDETGKETAKTTTPCASTLTDSDKIQIQLWKTYENSKYGYSFEYPETWQISSEGVDFVELTDNETQSNFYFRSGSMANLSPAPENFSTDSTKNIEVACVKGVETYTSDAHGDKGIVADFQKNNTKHVVGIVYKDIGASLSSDIVEAYDLILKTITFD